jgi:hypothetical protein
MKMQRAAVRAAVKRLAIASLLASVAGIGWAQQPLQFVRGHSAEKINRRRAELSCVARLVSALSEPYTRFHKIGV